MWLVSELDTCGYKSQSLTKRGPEKSILETEAWNWEDTWKIMRIMAMKGTDLKLFQISCNISAPASKWLKYINQANIFHRTHK